jgi:hypothetical protein
MDESLKQSIIDEEHLKLLSLFHYISGGLTLAFSFIFVFQFIFISVLLKNLPNQDLDTIMTGGGNFNPGFLSIFMYIWIFIFSIFIIFGILQILSGRFIKKRKYRIFTFVIAILNLFSFPYGTVLGVMSIIVHNRYSVIELYNSNTQ